MIHDSLKQEALNLGITQDEINQCNKSKSELIRRINLRKNYNRLIDEAKALGVNIEHCMEGDSYCVQESISNYNPKPPENDFEM